MESLDELRDEIRILADNHIDTDELVRIADAIEHEVEERYVEGPTDKNGDPITYHTMIHQWGALEYIACEMHTDGTYEWFVRGHDISAPLMKAKHVTIAKQPTVEEVLLEFYDEYDYPDGNPPDGDEILAKYAAKLQLRKES